MLATCQLLWYNDTIKEVGKEEPNNYDSFAGGQNPDQSAFSTPNLAQIAPVWFFCVESIY